jgi:UPF0271 protein
VKVMDINCDMGENAGHVYDGTQQALMRSITSANIACGGHAGDEAIMRATIEQAMRANVAVGAHPGYEDRANFGRRELALGADEIADAVHRQLLALAREADECGARIAHVKAHGALYNQAVRDRSIARAIAEGVKRWRTDVVLVGLAGPAGVGMLEEFRAAGFAVAAEAFADRCYEADGSLRSRKFEDALIRDPAAAASQAARIARGEGVIATGGTVVPMEAQTICVHGDTPGAVEIARAVGAALRDRGIPAQPFKI